MTVQPRASEPVVVDVALDTRRYDIVIGRGVIGSLGARIKALRPGAKVAVITDKTVATLHLGSVDKALSAVGISSSRIQVPPGEASKNYATFEKVCEALIAAKIERDDLVVALGGGVVGDLAGFAAAAIRRGLDFVQVPTTLLAQVDSSVGGKTGINLAARQEPDRRLPSAGAGDRRHRAARHAAAARIRAGYAEVVKYGLLGDAGFFSWLEANWQDVFAGGPGREHAIARMLPRQGRRSWRATSARPASARCSISATPSATRSRPRPAFPAGCCTARRWRSAWFWRSTSRPGSACSPPTLPARCAPSRGGRPADQGG